MRKWTNCVLLITLAIAFTSTSAQVQKISFGYENGLSLVSGRGNNILNSLQKAKLSFSAGIFIQYNINKNFSLRTNLSFERKGFSFGTRQGADSIGNPATIEAHSRFDYICLPLLARVYFGNKNAFFVNAGPYAGYLIGQAHIARINDGPKNIDKKSMILKGGMQASALVWE